METWTRGLKRFNDVRADHDPAQFCDVDYFGFVKDPVSAVEGIYAHFDIDFTDEARTAIADSHADSQKGPRARRSTPTRWPTTG